MMTIAVGIMVVTATIIAVVLDHRRSRSIRKSLHDDKNLRSWTLRRSNIVNSCKALSINNSYATLWL